MEQGALPDKKDRQSRHPFQRLYDAAGCQTAVPVLLGGEGLPAAACRILCGRRTMCALAGALSSQRLTRKE